jgi:hypothetical protein
MILDTDSLYKAYTILAPMVSILQATIGIRLIVKVLSIKDGPARILQILLSGMIVTGATGNIVVIACRNVIQTDQSAVLYVSLALYIVQLALLAWTAHYMSLLKGPKEKTDDI